MSDMEKSEFGLPAENEGFDLSLSLPSDWIVGEAVCWQLSGCSDKSNGTFMGYEIYPTLGIVREEDSGVIYLCESKNLVASSHVQKFHVVDEQELEQIHDVYKRAVETEVLDIDAVFAMAREYLRSTGGLSTVPICRSCASSDIDFTTSSARWDGQSQSLVGGSVLSGKCSACDEIFDSSSWTARSVRRA